MTVLRSSMLRALRRLRRNVRGATAIEYGLIAALIVIAMVSALHETANSTTTMWNNISVQVSNAIGGT